jgi:hypothetical protein
MGLISGSHFTSFFMTKEYEGVLQIDFNRGVIYFHSSATGCTLLRICRLPTPIPVPRDVLPEMIDITHMHGVSYAENNSVTEMDKSNE